MKTIITSIFAIAFVFNASAQDKQKMDADAIKKMCGCFEVTFNFAETFNYSKDSLYKPSETKVEKALEYAGLIKDEDGKISIQHLLQVGNPSDPMVVKHWRQDWLFENTDLYTYNSDNVWDFKKETPQAVSGQWTQKVYQVDDSPRYEGTASWVHVDGKSYWENTTPAPLARREYTTRSDYNVLLRGNRQEITSSGWIHDQDNEKIIKAAGKEDVLLAKEKGYNTYVKVEDSRCAIAISWWKENAAKWEIVRSKWDEVYGRNQQLSLETKVDNKPLYKHLFEEDVTTQSQINPIIESFVKK